jgi:hypothetical protein
LYCLEIAMRQFQRIFIALWPAILSFALPAADVPALRHATVAQAEPHKNNNAPNGLIGQPILGYITQSSPLRLRAILGVPGSAVLSGAMLLPANTARVHLAPGQAYALAERRNDDPAVVVLKAGSAGTAIPVDGAIQTPDVVAFSPTGQSALLWSATAGLQVIGGLPGTPAIVRTVGAAAFPKAIQDAAVSDDGDSVLLASEGGAYQLLRDGTTRQVISSADSAALAFLPNSSQAAIGDRRAGSVYLWVTGTGQGSASLLSTGLAGLDIMRATVDGQSLWITNPGGNSVWQLDIRTGGVRTFSLPVSPVSLDRLPYGEISLISSAPGQPTWILLSQGDHASAVFVPAAREKLRDIYKPGGPKR